MQHVRNKGYIIPLSLFFPCCFFLIFLKFWWFFGGWGFLLFFWWWGGFFQFWVCFGFGFFLGGSRGYLFGFFSDLVG